MKYTIEGFSQKKLLEYGLDIADALILRWFSDFSASGNMQKIFHDGNVYFLVKYQGLLGDLPLLGISTIKGLSKRFDKYVDAGLLKKTFRRIGIGTETYFSATHLLLELQYDPEKKLTPDKNSSSRQTGTPVPVEEPPQEPQLPSDENSSSCQTGTGVPVPLKNSSTTQVTTTTPLPDKQQLILVLQEEVKKYYSPAVFSVSFWHDSSRFVTESKIESVIPQYVEFVSEYTKTKKPKSPESYFYKVFCEGYMVPLFFARMKSKAEKRPEVRNITCPVCDTQHGEELNCPLCGLSYQSRGDKSKVELQRKLYFLPPEMKELIEREINEYIASKGSLADALGGLRVKTSEIYKKYGIEPLAETVDIEGAKNVSNQ